MPPGPDPESLSTIGPAGSQLALVVDLARAAAVADAATLHLLARTLGLHEAVTALTVVRTLHRHQVAQQVAGALRAVGEHAAADTIERLHARLHRRTPLPAPLLMSTLVEVQGAFGSAGVPVVVLKGPVLAVRLYGGLDRRPHYDLDLLVPRSARRRARRSLGTLGFRPERRDPHAVLFRRGDAAVDLHHALRAAPAYRIDEREVWGARLPVRMAGIDTWTLSDEHLLALLALSVAEDAAHGMVKLKQLLDLWLLVREVDGRLDWPRWFARRSRERTLSVVAAGLGLALSALDTWGDAPRLRAALAECPGALAVPSRARALDLVGAPRRAPASLAWFDSVYPGSLLAYRAHGFVRDVPAGLRRLGPGWLRHQLALARARRPGRA